MAVGRAIGDGAPDTARVEDVPPFREHPTTRARDVDEGSFHYLDYHRTVIGYHGTDAETAEKLVAGEPFVSSEDDDEWLGHGVYFWEYGPKLAWWWADRKKA